MYKALLWRKIVFKPVSFLIAVKLYFAADKKDLEKNEFTRYKYAQFMYRVCVSSFNACNTYTSEEVFGRIKESIKKDGGRKRNRKRNN
jgi:hypothetical protein